MKKAPLCVASCLSNWSLSVIQATLASLLDLSAKNMPLGFNHGKFWGGLWCSITIINCYLCIPFIYSFWPNVCLFLCLLNIYSVPRSRTSVKHSEGQQSLLPLLNRTQSSLISGHKWSQWVMYEAFNLLLLAKASPFWLPHVCWVMLKGGDPKALWAPKYIVKPGTRAMTSLKIKFIKI